MLDFSFVNNNKIRTNSSNFLEKDYIHVCICVCVCICPTGQKVKTRYGPNPCSSIPYMMPEKKGLVCKLRRHALPITVQAMRFHISRLWALPSSLVIAKGRSQEMKNKQATVSV